MTLKPDSGRTSGGGAGSSHGDWYDTAQICTNGHVINSCSVSTPHINRKFCERCGAQTITKCPYCSATMRGAYHLGPGTSSFTRPIFCPDCGKPYPWTDAALKAAQELSDELENLSPEECDLLKKSIDDIVRETPQATVAVSRFKRLVAKAGPVAADMYREILLPLLSETAKKLIWP